MYSDVVNWYVRVVLPTPDAPSMATLKVGTRPASIMDNSLVWDAALEQTEMTRLYAEVQSEVYLNSRLYDMDATH